MAFHRQHELDQQFEALRLERTSWVKRWKDLADYITPHASRFWLTDSNRGDRKVGVIMDNSATIAMRTLSAGLMSGITSPSRPWFQIRVDDPDLNNHQGVKEWLEQVRRRMAQVFLDSNLYTILPAIYSDLGAFGISALGVLEDKDDVIRCAHYPMGSYFLATDSRGKIRIFAREYQMTVRQVVEEFGLENCSTAVKSAWGNNLHDQWVSVRKMVIPNSEHDDSKLESKFQEFRSVTWEVGGNEDKFLGEKGFREFPVLCPRWFVLGEDVYGVGPGADVLGDVKALQLLQQRKAQAIDKMVDPPVVAPSSMLNMKISMMPGDVTYLPPDQIGAKFAPAYEINPRIEALLQDIQETQGRIRRGLFEDLFLLISSDTRSNVTAEEIMRRHEEKLLALGPVLERMNDEFLDPLIERTFAIMLRQGHIPPPPEEIQDLSLKIEYVSIMAQAQKMTGITGIERLAGFTGRMAAVYPEITDVLDPDEAVREYGDALGVSPKMVRDKGTVEAKRAERAQAQQMQQAMAMAQQGATAAKTLADTQVTDPSALSSMMQQLRGAMG